MKTFYEEDLQTKMFFDDNINIDLCKTLGDFYIEKSQFYSLDKLIRFKNSQLLYVHGEFGSFQNYTK